MLDVRSVVTAVNRPLMDNQTEQRVVRTVRPWDTNSPARIVLAERNHKYRGQFCKPSLLHRRMVCIAGVINIARKSLRLFVPPNEFFERLAGCFRCEHERRKLVFFGRRALGIRHGLRLGSVEHALDKADTECTFQPCQ